MQSKGTTRPTRELAGIGHNRRAVAVNLAVNRWKQRAEGAPPALLQTQNLGTSGRMRTAN